jgi:hypothetical protein
MELRAQRLAAADNSRATASALAVDLDVQAPELNIDHVLGQLVDAG